MAAKVAEVVGCAGERRDGVEGTGRKVERTHPSRCPGWKARSSKAAGLDEVDADGVGAGEVVGPGAVEVGG